MRPSWVEIDLGAVAANVAALAEAVAPAELWVVVKADGYGHGDVPVAEVALGAGAHRLAVALVEEGVRLREAGIDAPILLLSEPPVDVCEQIVEWRLTPTAYSDSFLTALEAAAREPLGVHLKVDTGMHRVGTDPNRIPELAARVAASSRLQLEALWTHLAVAEEDAEFTKLQLERLHATVDRLRQAGTAPRLLHAANSAGALVYPEGRLDAVRIGLAAYGLRPAPHVGADLPLRPAMRVVSHVSMVQRLPAGARPSYGRRRAMPADGWVATVPIGYADGVPRLLGASDGQVLIGGRRLPLAGTITMDQLMVDAGDHAVRPGDEVVLMGEQGDERITADEWAERLDTINYEVVCQIGPRLPRRYLR